MEKSCSIIFQGFFDSKVSTKYAVVNVIEKIKYLLISNSFTSKITCILSKRALYWNSIHHIVAILATNYLMCGNKNPLLNCCGLIHCRVLTHEIHCGLCPIFWYCLFIWSAYLSCQNVRKCVYSTNQISIFFIFLFINDLKLWFHMRNIYD